MLQRYLAGICVGLKPPPASPVSGLRFITSIADRPHGLRYHQTCTSLSRPGRTDRRSLAKLRYGCFV